MSVIGDLPLCCCWSYDALYLRKPREWWKCLQKFALKRICLRLDPRFGREKFNWREKWGPISKVSWKEKLIIV